MKSKIELAEADIWDLYDDTEDGQAGPFIVIPTNTTVKSNGNAVMGRGIAAQAANRFDGIKKAYGSALKNKKTINGFYVFIKHRIITIAVKYNWKDDADIDLIDSQLELLKKSSSKMNYGTVLVPMLGCGFGRLPYEQVLPLLLKHSFDNMLIVVPPNQLYASEEYRESFLPGINNKKDKRVDLSKCFSDINM
jgi:hypothetical protein